MIRGLRWAAVVLAVLASIGWADPSAVPTSETLWGLALLSASVVVLSAVSQRVLNLVIWWVPSLNYLLPPMGAVALSLAVAGVAWPLTAAILGSFTFFWLLILIRVGRAGQGVGPVPADIAALVRGIARFALPAVSYSLLSGVVPGTHPESAWPGLILGALSAGAALVFGLAMMATRPRSAVVCQAEFEGKNVLAYGGPGNVVWLFDVAARRWMRALGSGASLPAPLDAALETEFEAVLETKVEEPDEAPEYSTPPAAPSPPDEPVQAPFDVLERPVRRLLPGLVRALCVIPLPAGNLLASAGDDAVVHLWSTDTGEYVGGLRGTRAAVHALCVIRLQDGVLLASAGDRRRVTLWDVADSRRPLRTLRTSLRYIRALCPVRLEDGEFLAVAGARGRVEIWDPASGRLLRQMTTQPGTLHALCTVPADGRLLLASASSRGTITLWDPAHGDLVRSWKATSPAALHAICPVQSARGSALLAAGDSPYAALWTLSGETLRVHDLGLAAPGVWSMCQLLVRGKPLIATAGYGKLPHAFDPVEALPVPPSDPVSLPS